MGKGIGERKNKRKIETKMAKKRGMNEKCKLPTKRTSTCNHSSSTLMPHSLLNKSLLSHLFFSVLIIFWPFIMSHLHSTFLENEIQFLLIVMMILHMQTTTGHILTLVHLDEIFFACLSRNPLAPIYNK